MHKINVLVAGSTGYIGIELVKILINHKYVNIKYLCGNTSAGKSLSNYDKNLRNKLREEAKDALRQENLLNEEDKIILLKLYNKIKKEFETVDLSDK